MVIKSTRVEVIPTIGKRTLNSSTNMAGGKKKTGRKSSAKRAHALRAVQGKGQTGGKVNWRKVGKAIMDANRFIKDNKLVSKGATFLNDIGVPYAGRVAAAAAKQGYGKQAGRGALKF